MTCATLFFVLITLPTAAVSDATPRPVVLDFTATWCGPCRQMKPAVERLVGQGYPIKAVDVDRSPDLAERYKVSGVPTFVVVDPASGKELGRTSGLQPAENLVALYNQARARMPSRTRVKAETAEADDAERDNDRDDDRPTARAQAPDREADDAPEPARDAPRPHVNPKPWETVVRIKVHGAGAIGFGSGTIIASTPQESLILTCAHIFKYDSGPQDPPSRFRRRITIDLFDGSLGGPKNNQVHYTQETFAGEAVDYDFSRDVGLIRIRPGRRLPAARVVPPYWKPAPRMGMVTVGCSEGHDATAWNTVIVNPAFRGLAGQDSYEAIECMIAPKQGRSGGGLFTSDGYVAGVCDFAEPRGNHGLYAAPKSIYHILDRNKLMALYLPPRSRPETLVADNGDAAGRRPTRAAGERDLVARFQSPGRDDPGGVSLPPPGMLGIKPPVLARGDDRPAPARRGSWQPTPSARPADLKMDPALDTDRFAAAEPTGSEAEPDRGPIETEAQSRGPAGDGPAAAAPKGRSPGGKWKPGRSPLPELSGVGMN